MLNTFTCSGTLVAGLVDALAPGLCPDWEDFDPKKAKDNATEAIEAAEKWLNVPQVCQQCHVNRVTSVTCHLL